MERQALDRWGHGDPSGFLEISDPEIVYFDPFIEKRIDGITALTAYYQPLRGQIHIDQDEILYPKVQIAGEACVLTFNYQSRSGTQSMAWNCTEVYRKSSAGWRIIQTHWSPTKPSQ